MKYKKDFGGFIVLLAIAWPAFHLIRNTYTPSQVILAAIFSYIGIRLTYFVYFKNWEHINPDRTQLDKTNIIQIS